MRTSTERYSDQLTAVQLLRAEGRTRKATVNGKSVRFSRLSDGCHVNPTWACVWTGHYADRMEALKAAERWEERMVIEDYGFTRKA